MNLSRIKRPWLRRLLMFATLPFMICLLPFASLLRGVLEVIVLSEILYTSWAPCWRGESAPGPAAETGVDRGNLIIKVPLSLLAKAAEFAPFIHEIDPDSYEPGDGFKVVDPVAFGRAVAARIRAEQSEDAGTLLHEMIDDAMEQVVELDMPGWVWPAYGKWQQTEIHGRY